MKKVVIIVLWGMFLSFCSLNIIDAYMHRPKKIQGNYYIDSDDIDGNYTYGIFCIGKGPYHGYEAVKLIGVDGIYIYWTTFDATNYRIDTSKEKQIRIHEIPNEVKMMPIIEFYNALD